MRRSDQAPLMLQISGGDIITLPMELELLHGILASARTRAQHRTSGDPADMAAVCDNVRNGILGEVVCCHGIMGRRFPDGGGC